MAAALDQQPALNRVTSCDRHPDQEFTGFCASCLRERLAGLETANRRLNSSSSVSSGASAALRSLFFRPSGNHHGHGNADVAGSSSRLSFLPELRRCQSFSGGRGVPSASSMEPQRKSCDVRVRNTLWSLFHLDDGGGPADGGGRSFQFPPNVHSGASNAGPGGVNEVERRSRRFDPRVVAIPVIESAMEEEEEEENSGGGEIEEATLAPVGVEGLEQGSAGIKTEHLMIPEEDKQEAVQEGEEEPKTMNDHNDLNARGKKPSPKDLKEIAGSFWLAASVFSKKLQKWRRKQKLKKQENTAESKASAAAIPAVKPCSRSRRFSCDSQLELAGDIFRRRSCDIDPRFSLDVGRMSLDDPRFSWDEPRASWDGYLTGGRSVFPRLPPMLSVTEDGPATAPCVQRLDGQIPVEEDTAIPGGSAQTRDYYLDTSQRRRRSLDRSSSVRRPSFEADELPRTSNAKASPTAMATEYFNFVNKFERDCRDSNPMSLRDEYSESFDSAFRGSHNGVSEGNPKKSRRWSKAWSLWGLIHRRSRSRGAGANVVERSFSETWPELRKDRINRKVFRRCSSSVSSRHSSNVDDHAGSGSRRRSRLEVNGARQKGAGEFVLERNKSARYSPSRLDNGLTRLCQTPMRGSRRSNGLGKGRHLQASSLTRSMLQLY